MADDLHSAVDRAVALHPDDEWTALCLATVRFASAFAQFQNAIDDFTRAEATRG